MKYFLVVLICSINVITKAQNNSHSIGGIGTYFLEVTSKPIEYHNDKAFAIGQYYDCYKPNGIKLQAGINYYRNTFSYWHYDKTPTNGIIALSGKSTYFYIPLVFSYNFLKNEPTPWQTFVNIGYTMFLHTYTQTNYTHTQSTAYPKTEELKSVFINNYITAGICARYLVKDKFYLGFGTTSYQFFKLGKHDTNGFPSLSIEVLAGTVL
jgi:hypothetical protein